MKSLMEISNSLFPNSHSASKGNRNYQVYETFISALRQRKAGAVLELGVFEGASLKILGTYFPNAKIVGVDIIDRSIDLSGFSNIKVFVGDQSDEDFIGSLLGSNGIDELDLVIDDASHVGWFSRESFRFLFPKLRSGGIYIIEDWGTGYWSEWPDGSSFQSNEPISGAGTFPKRFVSHDNGMVGFIKSLVDEVGYADIKERDHAGLVGQVAEMHIFPSFAILRKA
jgi:SAM-dependent methyltransferase